MTDSDTNCAGLQPRRGDLAVLVCLALAKLLLHFYTNIFAGYGIFRDELYYLACSEHLSGGYVDHPPLSVFILAANRGLFGDSIFALRLLPALAGALTVLLTGLMARELGGGRFAQVMAACAAIVSLSFLAFGAIYSMNSFDILLQSLAAYVVIKIIKTRRPVYWLMLGLVFGLGLLNKISVLWLGFGLFGGLLLTPERTWLKTKWPYLAGLAAMLVFMPFVLWNFTHRWAHLEFMRNATATKYHHLTALSFAVGQVLLHNPLTLPLWLSGLALLFFAQERRFSLLGYMYAGAFIVLAVNGHSKPEYLAAAYAMVFAAGGVALERCLTGSWRWVRPVYLFVLCAAGLLLAPFALPILPIRTYIRYAAALGIAPHTSEAKDLDQLPQSYADMFGWQEKAAAVSKVFHSLTPEEQTKCALFSDNYGRCGAIDFYGPSYGLPKSIGCHNNYWIWGPRDYTGELLLVLGGNLKDKQQSYESVEVAGVVHSDYCMPYENDLRIYVCRNLKVPLKELWPKLKSFN